MRHHRSPHGFLWRRSDKERGQGIAEFALIWPIFVVCVMALLEFGVAFNNLLTINYASRNAALLGAEAGNNPCADVIILTSVEKDVTAPAQDNRIASVAIYYSDVPAASNRGSGQSVTRQRTDRTRTGSTCARTRERPTPCRTPSPLRTLATRTTTVATRSTVAPAYRRGAGQASTWHSTLDTIGVTITYNYSFITPLSGAITLLRGNGNFNGGNWTFVQSQQMRMEPIL